MKYLFLLSILIASTIISAQTEQQFVIDGAISLSNSNTETPVEGTLRWNSSEKEFQGYDGANWVSFGSVSSHLTGNWGSTGPFTYEDKIVLSPTPTHRGTFSREISCEDNFTAISDKYLSNRVIRLYNGEQLVKTITRNDTEGRYVPRNFDISNDLVAMGDSVVFVYDINEDKMTELKSDSVFIADDPGHGFAFDGRHIVTTTIGGFLYHFMQENDGDWIEQGVIWDKTITGNQAVSGEVLAFKVPTGVQIMEFDGATWKEVRLIPPVSGYLINDIDIQSDRLAITQIQISTSNFLESTGLIHIYDRNNNWNLSQSISNPNLGFPFGQIAIQGNTIIAHTELYSEPGQSLYNGQGKVHVYENNNNTWSRTAILTSSDGRAGGQFGWGAFPRINNIDLTEDRIVIGNRSAHIIPGDPSNDQHGKAYIFYRK